MAADCMRNLTHLKKFFPLWIIRYSKKSTLLRGERMILGEGRVEQQLPTEWHGGLWTDNRGSQFGTARVLKFGHASKSVTWLWESTDKVSVQMSQRLGSVQLRQMIPRDQD